MIANFIERNHSKSKRAAEIFPGLALWTLILSPIWFSLIFGVLLNQPWIVIDVYGGFIIVLSIYWFLRASMTTVGTVIGYEYYRRARQTDWLKKCMELAGKTLPNPETLPKGQFLPKQLLIYPVANSNDYATLQATLNGIVNQNYPRELIYIAISMEERMIRRNPEHFKQMQERIYSDYAMFGDRLMIFEHPDGLQGEVIGAAANRAWGGKSAVAELLRRGENISDFLVTSPDEDLVFHKEYLGALTYQFLINPKRKQRFYQTALYTFNNNYWDVPILIRVLSASLTIPVLASSATEKDKRETFSCYTLALDVLVQVGYWDVDLGIDDTTFYWKPFFFFKGDWSCEVFYIPLSADAVYNPSYIKNHREQYKQYVRWGWGVISFPIAALGLLSKPGIPFIKRIEKLWHIFQVFVFWKVLVYLLTLAIPIVFLINPHYHELIYWYSLPNTLSKIMGLAVFFIVPTTIYKALVAPPVPSNWSKLKYFVILLVEAPLNIIIILTYSFIPFVEATTRYMLGQKPFKSVSWTEKVATKPSA